MLLQANLSFVISWHLCSFLQYTMSSTPQHPTAPKEIIEGSRQKNRLLRLHAFKHVRITVAHVYGNLFMRTVVAAIQ